MDYISWIGLEGIKELINNIKNNSIELSKKNYIENVTRVTQTTVINKHMKKLLLFLFTLITIQVKSQSKNLTITLPLDSVTITKNKLISNVYNISLNIKNNDNRFFLDTYTFQVINSKSFNELTFKQLREPLLTNIQNKITLENLKKMSPCSVHELFSLTNVNSNRIFIIKKYNEKEYFWRISSYSGTSKNGGITKLN